MLEEARLTAMGREPLPDTDVIREREQEADPWEELAKELDPKDRER
jgi:hypothetical protein